MPGLWIGQRPPGEVVQSPERALEIHNIFKGYVDSWDQGWPDGGWSDAVVTLSATDHTKVLSLDNLPTTSPVRGGYDEVVAPDVPAGYWRLNEPPDQLVQTAEITEPNPIAPGSTTRTGRDAAWHRRGGWFPDRGADQAGRSEQGPRLSRMRLDELPATGTPRGHDAGGALDYAGDVRRVRERVDRWR